MSHWIAITARTSHGDELARHVRDNLPTVAEFQSGRTPQANVWILFSGADFNRVIHTVNQNGNAVTKPISVWAEDQLDSSPVPFEVATVVEGNDTNTNTRAWVYEHTDTGVTPVDEISQVEHDSDLCAADHIASYLKTEYDITPKMSLYTDPGEREHFAP